MSLLASVSHVFRPVGQGLFAQGWVRERPGGLPLVTWVHDCGASSLNSEALHREVERAHKRLHAGRPLDVLIISHFDEDHVNGLGRLLAKVRVRTVVMPYATPADRLLFAVRHRGPVDPEYVEFLVSPIDFLRRRTEVTEVIAIDGDDSQGSFVGDDSKDPRPINVREIVPQVRGPERTAMAPGAHAIGERVFRGHASITYGGFWEFLFFNRRAWRGCLPALRAAVKDVLEDFQKLPLEKRNYGELIAKLRVLYRDRSQFGRSEAGRNEISLQSYAGPVGSPGVLRAGTSRYVAVGRQRLGGLISRQNPAYGILYTGDVTMRPGLRDDLQNRVLGSRWERLGVLQVPHHGAAKAWKDIPVDEWRHRWSVFSYGEKNTYGHPGGSTVDAFKRRHSPVRVTEDFGFAWWYVAEWPSYARKDTKRTHDE